MGCDINKGIKRMYDEEWLEESQELRKFHTWEELGWQGVAAIMGALK